MFEGLQERLIRVLRWSEKYTKTDMVYLAHGTFWLSGSSIITGAVSFALALAFANLLTKDAYGTYKYVLTLFGILCVACLRGMDTAVTQGAARGNDGTVISGLRSKRNWSLLGSLGALAVAAYYFYGGNNIVAIAMIFAAFFIPFMEPYGIFNAVLVGKRDFKLSSLLGIAGQIAAGIPLVITLFFTNNPIIIFIVYAASWTLSRYISLQVTLKKYPPNEKQEPHALSYALHSSAINASNILISSLDAILVYHYLGAAELALYAFAMAPVQHARTILNTPAILATPKFAAQDTATLKHMLYKRSLILFGLGIALTLGYCVLAYPFYMIFFPQYIEVVPLSMLFSVTIALMVGNTLIGSVIDSRATLIPRRLLYLWNIPSIIMAVGAFLLIQSFGLWGAIVSQVLSYASACAIAWVMWYAIRNKDHAPT
ncbi:oligosaccharide flippase family protein [Candidatus Kaiserbacteria bacterium]|nr:oligosaccharide flippase family protein [Candidatus Kaiserbacteria bacterium]